MGVMRNESKELKLSEGAGVLLEKRILDIVAASGDAGILQRDVWHLLNIDSRRGVRIVKRLERMGFLTRELVVHKGRRMYLLKPTPKLLLSPQLPDSLDEVPCFYCPKLLECASEAGRSLNCERLEKWLHAG
ncbi:MAG TPA: transcription factor TFIIIC [Thermofilaceae archaeon]|nr:transcription factor TFIIIC [Thermofilaceae archaeon]